MDRYIGINPVLSVQMSRKLNFSEEHVLMKLYTVAVDDLRMYMNKGDNSRDNIIPHLHNLFLFQCDVTRSLNRSEARSKLFIDQGRTTLYRLLRFIGQYRCTVVFT